MSNHPKTDDEPFAFVNEEKGTLYIALTKRGRSRLLREALVITLKDETTIKTVVLKHMSRRISRAVQKGEKEHAKKETDKPGPTDQEDNAGDDDNDDTE